jgi:predicted transport protein
MATLNYAKPERIWLKTDPDHDERWLQDRIADDPGLLGLGNLLLKDRERIQPAAGRLDLLFAEQGTGKRYEVELQLGRTDEAHIIRTIEYWDIERKRYPQFEHTAVLVAEDITSRFLNVVGLFNGFIPLVAIQVSAIKLGDSISLVFTTVLDEMPLGLPDEEDEARTIADRGYWEARSSKAVLAVPDEIVATLRAADPDLELKYNKAYIGLVRRGRSDNFVSFYPRKDYLWLSIRLPRDEAIQARLDEAGLESNYQARYGNYEIRLRTGDLARHKELLDSLMSQAQSGGD